MYNKTKVGDKMKYRDFRNEIKISELGFGGWQLGNAHDWNNASYNNGVLLVREAYNNGVNFFDTAPNYSNGNSEKIIGEALKDVRDKVFINTKYGHWSNQETNYDSENIETSINQSLSRLKTNYLDSIILHNPPRYVLEGKTNHEEVFKRMISFGKIRYWGVSIDTVEEVELVLNNLDVDVIELFFNINFQAPKLLFNKIKEKGILLIIKIPLDSGWLTGKYDQSSKFKGIRSRWTKDDIDKRSKIVREIKSIVKDDYLVKYALAFVLGFSAVTTVIPGTKDLTQLYSNLESINYQLPIEIKEALEKLYEEKIKYMNLVW
jgi:aryl-alcohol dehydrogenase-like predicted oxidoreductase